MTLCREWTLVKHLPDTKMLKMLVCRSWSCDLCRPVRKKQLMAKAAAGRPTRFVTLTVNPNRGNSPSERLLMLSNAWRLIVKRLRRWKPGFECEFLAVVEETAAGEPHLHILLRSGYVPQAMLSAWMGELIDAPIVDIRAVGKTRGVVAYVAKYITKAPKQFDRAKRYWSSGAWESKYVLTPQQEALKAWPWAVVRQQIQELIAALGAENWIEEWNEVGPTVMRRPEYWLVPA